MKTASVKYVGAKDSVYCELTNRKLTTKIAFYARLLWGLISTFFLFCPLSPRPLTHFYSFLQQNSPFCYITSCLKLRNRKTMKARGLGTKNSIVNFLPVFEKYSSFERTVFFIVMLTDALELRETNHFLFGPAVHCKFSPIKSAGNPHVARGTL